MVLSLLQGIGSMERFLGAHNAIRREEQDRIRGTVPRWRLFRRRRMAKALVNEMDDLLTADELRLDRGYNRQATGWAFIMVGALIACGASWLQAGV